MVWCRFLPGAPGLAEGDGARGHLLCRCSDGWVPQLGQQGCVDGNVVLSLLKQPTRNGILKSTTFYWHSWSKVIPSARYTNTRASAGCGRQPEKLSSCLITPVQCWWARQRPRPACLRCNNSFINKSQHLPSPVSTEVFHMKTGV